MSFESVARSGIKIKPLLSYPGKMTAPRRCPYRSPFNNTIKTLLKELKDLQAKYIVLEVALTDNDFRNDGLPRAQAKMSSHAVVLSFDSKRGPLRLYGCKFHNWADNLRAIAMHLEHLRLSMIHGIGEDGEQYKGWKAITQTRSRFVNKRAAAEFIAKYAYDVPHLMVGSIMIGGATLADGYRRAAARLHPDTDGGDEESFKALGEAKTMLEAP